MEIKWIPNPGFLIDIIIWKYINACGLFYYKQKPFVKKMIIIYLFISLISSAVLKFSHAWDVNKHGPHGNRSRRIFVILWPRKWTSSLDANLVKVKWAKKMIFFNRLAEVIWFWLRRFVLSHRHYQYFHSQVMFYTGCVQSNANNLIHKQNNLF